MITLGNNEEMKEILSLLLQMSIYKQMWKSKNNNSLKKVSKLVIKNKVFFDILVQKSLEKFSFAVSKNEVEREKKEKITNKDLDLSVDYTEEKIQISFLHQVKRDLLTIQSLSFSFIRSVGPSFSSLDSSSVLFALSDESDSIIFLIKDLQVSSRLLFDSFSKNNLVNANSILFIIEQIFCSLVCHILCYKADPSKFDPERVKEIIKPIQKCILQIIKECERYQERFEESTNFYKEMEKFLF